MSGVHMLRDTATITQTATKLGTYGDTVNNPAASTIISSRCFFEWNSSREGLTDGIEQSRRRARATFPLRTPAGTILNINVHAEIQIKQGGDNGQDLGVWRVTDKGSNDFVNAGIQVCELEKLDSDG